jgi:hypothetical protein
MDLIERYDELDNIVSSIRTLVDEISDIDYKEQLQYIQYQAENELMEVETEMQKESDREEEEMNRQFINERI